MKVLAIFARIIGLSLLAFGGFLLIGQIIGHLYSLGIMACGLWLMFPERMAAFGTKAKEWVKS